MMIPVNSPDVNQADIERVAEDLRLGRLSGSTVTITGLELALAAHVGTAHAVAVANGSCALDLACEVAGVSPGDEVVLPTLTIVSCLAPILRRGARPVFVDASPSDWNMDLDQVVSSVGPRTRAIIAVHTYGLGLDIPTLRERLGERPPYIIEDAAEALGVFVRNRPCGSLGDVAIHSFYANKVITGGEGGALTLEDYETAEDLRALRNLDFGAVERFRHERAAWNFRMSSLQGALIHSQLDRIQMFLEHRRQVGLRYREQLSHLPGLEFQPLTNSVSENGHWVVAVTTGANTGVTGEMMRSRLAEEGIETRALFAPLHRQPVLARFGFSDQETRPVAESLYARGLYLPCGNGISFDSVDKVCSAVDRVYYEVFS